jgi:SAM-dependent methyltransferase
VSAPVRAEERPLSDSFFPVRCALCDSDDYEAVANLDADYEYVGIIDDRYARGSFRVVRCRRCSLVYLNPRPSLEQVLHYYPDEYCCFSELPPRSALIRVLYRVLVSLKGREVFRRLPKDGVLLDFGCGTGHWLSSLRPSALATQRFVGIDATESAVSKLRAQGIEAHVGDDQSLVELFEPDSIDLILLNHVIEHVPDPVATLRRLGAVLKPGGEIHGATPNVDAWDPVFFKDAWVGWHVPRHFVLFDHATLERIVKEAGLELISLRSSLEAASHWAMSLHNLAARRVGWTPRPGKLRMGVYPLVLAVAMGVTALQLALSRTSVMTFVLRKPTGD